MFTRLERRIRMMLILIVSFSLILSSLLLYLALRRNIFANYVQLATQYANQQDRNADLYLSLIEETAKLLSGDEDIIHALQNPRFDSVLISRAVAKLSGIQTASVALTGITMYGLNGVCYASESIGLAPNNPPTLKQLMADPLFREFAGSGRRILWWVRYQKTIKFPVYNSNIHGGLITLVLKIYDPNNQPVGYLLVDTKVNSFFLFFKDQEGRSGAYLIGGAHEVLAAAFNQGLPRKAAEDLRKMRGRAPASGSYLAADRGVLYLTYRIPHSASSIVKVVSLSRVRLGLWGFLCILILLNAGLIVLIVITGRTLSRSISRPLAALFQKMQQKI